MQSGQDFNKYEDFTRAIMGSKAYLLFSFDKLIIQTAKQLLNIANDDASQKSIRMFSRFQTHLESKKSNDQQTSDQWQNESIYLANFANCMNEINSFNGYGVRLLYSPISEVLSIHYFNLNPFAFQDKKNTQENVAYTESVVNYPVDPNDLPLSSNVFLRRMKKVTQRTRGDLIALINNNTSSNN